MTLTNTSTPDEFKQTKFYTTTKEYMLTNKFLGKQLSLKTVEEVLMGTYWRMFFNDGLEGIQ
tara:strand:+ start:83 stop:268 length:186 start_codon:yes stop_codon:yes gene_type:complete